MSELSGNNPGNFDAPMDAAELADLYAVGALTPQEAAAFEEKVRAGDPAFVLEFRRVQAVAESMVGGAAQPMAPPQNVRAKLAIELGAAGAPAEPAAQAAHQRELVGAGTGESARFDSAADRGEIPGISIARGGADEALRASGLDPSRFSRATGRWYPTGIRGVKFRSLQASRRENRRAILLDMAPGTELPEHDHTGTETVIMLAGDLDISGTSLNAGDVIRITAGADHGVPRTRSGCTCIVVSGYQPFPILSWVRMAWSVVRGWFGPSR